MARDLKNKVILITGGSSGIGAATAVKCATLGMDVAITGRNEQRLLEVADRIETFGRKAFVSVCDVDDEAQINQTVDDTFEHFGRLDAVFANAGYGLFKTFEQTTDADYAAIFHTNFYGTVYTIRAALPKLRQTGAAHGGAHGGLKHILICSSSASEIGIPYFGAYCASKAMQDSVAGALRAELAEEGMPVTSVHPIGTKTNFFGSATDRQGGAAVDMNTPEMFMQSTDRVATWISRALLRPRPEVWPSSSARWMMALCTALPRIPAWLMRRHARKIRQSNR